jgi:hypothetical protein
VLLLLLAVTSVTKKFMTSLFMSSFATLTAASLASHCSLLMLFLLAVVGGMGAEGRATSVPNTTFSVASQPMN